MKLSEIMHKIEWLDDIKIFALTKIEYQKLQADIEKLIERAVNDSYADGWNELMGEQKYSIKATEDYWQQNKEKYL